MAGHEHLHEMQDGDNIRDISSEENQMIQVVKQENYSEAGKYNGNRELQDNMRPRSNQESTVMNHGYRRQAQYFRVIHGATQSNGKMV